MNRFYSTCLCAAHVGITSVLLVALAGADTPAQAQRGTVSELRAAAPPPASPFSTTLIAPLLHPYPLPYTNANRAVVHNGVLHLVYVYGNGDLMYTSSTDAQTWASPQLVEAGGVGRVALAVTPSGVIGVVYSKGSSLEYRYHAAGMWSAATPIPGSAGMPAPAMVAYGEQMHLVSPVYSHVVYGTFPATAPASIQSENVNDHPGCVSAYVQYPSIAVAPYSPTDPQPRIRVAFFLQQSGIPGCVQPGFEFGMVVHERPLVPAMQWPIVYSGYGPRIPATTSAVSVSMAANRATGDFFLAYSSVDNGVASTALERHNPWTNQNQSIQLLAARASVHVTPGACTDFRVAVSDLGTQSNVYNPTWYREGTWSGTATAPTWSSPQVSIGAARGMGAAAAPVVWEKHFGPSGAGFTRRLRAILLTPTTSGHALQDVYDNISGPQVGQPCNLPPPAY
jgi:hypothetical protein